MPLLDRTGQVFGRLMALERSYPDDKWGRARWRCLCVCGLEATVDSRHLGSGASRSCGCLARESASLNGKTGAPKISRQRSPRFKVVVGYQAAHQRIWTERGPARDRPCVDCGGCADHWSYDGSDPGELTEGTLRYSLDSQRYAPRCVPCHSAFDGKAARPHD